MVKGILGQGVSVYMKGMLKFPMTEAKRLLCDLQALFEQEWKAMVAVVCCLLQTDNTK